MQQTTNINNKNNYITTDLRIMFWNTRSVIRIKEELLRIVKNLDIFIGVELWLVATDFAIPGFIVLRKDRPCFRGGGIIFLVHKNIAFVEVKNVTCPDRTEICCIKITNIKEPINIIACYRSPTPNLTQDEWDSIISNVNLGKRNILMGDFNAHNQLWNCHDTDINGARLYNSMLKYNLFLHNSDSLTRVDFHRGNKSNIDLICSDINIAQNIDVKINQDTCGSDHFPILINVCIQKSFYHKKTFKVPVHSKKTDWNKFQQILGKNYNRLLSHQLNSLTPSEKYSFFIEEITNSLKISTPRIKRVSLTKHRNPVEWWDQDCERAKRQRTAAYKKWDHTKDLEYLISYKKLIATAKKCLCRKKEKAFKSLQELSIYTLV